MQQANVINFAQFVKPLTGMRDPLKINTYDIDGVIWLPDPYTGLKPEEHDIIITGRSIEEEDETYAFLDSRGIYNEVYFNPLPFDEKSRKSSGHHKARTINALLDQGYKVGIHFEDDPVQAEIITNSTNVQVVLIQHNLVELENVRRPFTEH